MPDNDLRAEQVAKLTTSPPLPAEVTDAILDSTDAEREAAAGLLLERTRAFLEQTGVLRPTVGALELSYRTATAICATLGTVQGVWSQPAFQDRPLGDVLKVVGPREADWVIGVLRWGGLLPPE